MPNLRLKLKRDLSPFRKMAIGTWNAPGDPSVYGTLELRMEAALEYLARFREKTGRKATITHLLARAMGSILKETPDANAILRGHKIYLRQDIGIFVQVAITEDGEGKADLSGVTLHDVDKKSLAEICDEMTMRAKEVRAHKDAELERSRSLFHRLPYRLVGPVLDAMSFLFYTLNLDPRFAGVPKDAFGSVMITNVGTLGLDTAYAPLVPFSRVPILLTVGAVKDQPVVDDGVVKPGKVMKINVTFDHRFIDGVHGAAMSKAMRAWMERPFEHFDKLD
ncbi:MAG: 2-oxo acid dehydrogenase subunit E2 [Deltaproteobacteria bacterium]|nr:2-oxo acid dehydrogenase subunit E2 [Deltaproteobacteria bacterium]